MSETRLCGLIFFYFVTFTGRFPYYPKEHLINHSPRYSLCIAELFFSTGIPFENNVLCLMSFYRVDQHCDWLEQTLQNFLCGSRDFSRVFFMFWSPAAHYYMFPALLTGYQFSRSLYPRWLIFPVITTPPPPVTIILAVEYVEKKKGMKLLINA